MTPSELKSRIFSSLICQKTVRITTSGYQDRFLRIDAEYVASIGEDGDGPILRWRNEEEARSAIEALTGAEWREVYEMAKGCETNYVGLWQSKASSWSGPIRPNVIDAVLRCVQTNYTETARSEAASVAATVTKDERAFVAWGLAECNRLNQRLVDAGLRRGTETQVHIAGFEIQ
jgi:hypothetical protein